MNYRHKHSEFEVQSVAYSILKKNLTPKGFVIRGEYRFKEHRQCKPDITIFKKGYPPVPVLVIEVKKTADGTCTKQGERYASALDVPYLYIRGMNDAFLVLEKVKPFLNTGSTGIEYK